MARPKLSNAELNEILDKAKHDQIAKEALIEEQPKPTDDQIADYIAKHSKYSTKQIAEHFHIEPEDVLQVKITKADEIRMISTAFAKAQEHEKAKKAQQETPVMKPEVVMAARAMAEGAVENKPEKAELTEQDKAKAEELAEDIANAKSVKEMKNEDPNFVLVPEAPAEKPKKVLVQEPLPEGGVRVSFKDRAEDEEDRCGACPLICDIPSKPRAVISDMVPAEPKADYSALKEFASEAFGLDEPNVEQHRAITRSMTEMYKRKNHDYGDSFHKLYGEFGPVYLVMHLTEKLERVKTLMKDGNLVAGESMKDSLMDIANYAVMGVMEIGESAKC